MTDRRFAPPVDQGVPLGAIDFHCHLDRAWTFMNCYLDPAQLSTETVAYKSLTAKQNMVGDFHRTRAYEKKELKLRMDALITAKYRAGERGMNAVIDTSADCVGMTAIEVALELRAKWAKKGYDLRVGAYPIFGFKTHGSDREMLIREAAPHVQFLCGLPERERKNHEVTFERHIRTLLEIGCEHHLPVHFHLDQANAPFERGTERLIEGMRYFDSPKIDGVEGPTVWAVHVISPSCYEPDRFQRLVDGLLEFKIGVIVCPVAGGSMRQLNVYQTRTHNCIARVWDFVAAGVPVLVGTDNDGDPFVPLWKPTLDRETAELTTLTRFYDYTIIRKLLLGEKLTEVDLDNVRQFLEIDRQANRDTLHAHPVS